jgi:hypothetical protein
MDIAREPRLFQLPDRGLKRLAVAFVILVSRCQAGHLALKSLELCKGLDNKIGACGWSNAGHKTPVPLAESAKLASAVENSQTDSPRQWGLECTPGFNIYGLLPL